MILAIEEAKYKFDSFIRQMLAKGLEKKHTAITKLVKDKLASYTDEDLIQTIESRVGDDLQMIRLNGTIVGGIAGKMKLLLNCKYEQDIMTHLTFNKIPTFSIGYPRNDILFDFIKSSADICNQ